MSLQFAHFTMHSQYNINVNQQHATGDVT